MKLLTRSFLRMLNLKARTASSLLTVDPKLFWGLFFTFILMTAVGTVSHELGHYTTARILGHEAGINYRSTWFNDQERTKYLSETFSKYSHEIENKKDFPDKERFYAISEDYESDHFWVSLGGPLQTMLTGTLALFLLLGFKNRVIQEDRVSFWGWLLVIFSLFWLRQVANFFVALFHFLKHGTASARGDEAKLALYLDLNIWSIQLITALMGLAILGYIVLKILPQKAVFTFLLSGLLGGLSGYYLWLIRFGPLILP